MAASDIVFVVPGQPQGGTRGGPAGSAVPSGGVRGRVKAAVRVGVQRDGGAVQRIAATPGEDVVVLTIANGPTLVLHPERARELLRAQQTAGAPRSGGSDVDVPAQLGWPALDAAATRDGTGGPLPQATLDSIEVIGDLLKDPAADLVAAKVTNSIDGRVNAGVYALSQNQAPGSLKTQNRLADGQLQAADRPALVLIHGTFVDTDSTYGKFWSQQPAILDRLFRSYGERGVYALDHPTLTASPFANALTLVRGCAPKARLHLLTHSRGGLVAEALARACAGQPLNDDDLAPFGAPEHARQRAELTQLYQEAQAKQIAVERMVRVACPARGTLLAGKRLDAYLSVLKWALQLGGVPVLPELVDFLTEVARRRADPEMLPGLEAMLPSSPTVQWLNQASEPIGGDLRVIAGDLEGESLLSWTKTLLADAFFWTDNDLVVQTRSMYGGAPRYYGLGRGATFVLDRGAKVTHFNYFSNAATAQAIADGLTEIQPLDFRQIGPRSWAGDDASGTRAARAVQRSGGDMAGARPALFVLPGILGSNLGYDGHRIWLGVRFVNGLKRLAWDPAGAAVADDYDEACRIRADRRAGKVYAESPIGKVYDDLIEKLADSHEVIPFAFDWRRPIQDEARRLAQAVERALAARADSKQPVRLLAHSMGGLVARTMQLEAPDTWRAMMSRSGARVLMLGTPNGGSWAPMQVLSGDDSFGNMLTSFGALFDKDSATATMAGMPGFLQMQAGLLDAALNLGDAATWSKLAADDLARLTARIPWHVQEQAQRLPYTWSTPGKPVLDAAVELRRRLDAQARTLGDDARNLLLVVGRAPFTPDGYLFGDDGLEYLNARDGGDGRVTYASACLPGVRTWRLDAAHGDLPSRREAFDAYVELLQRGETALLPGFDGAATRGAEAAAAAAPPERVRSRPARGRSVPVPPSDESEVFAGTTAALPGRAAEAPLQVEVRNGDLRFVAQPLLIGHYRSLQLAGTERVVDGLVGGALGDSIAAQLYPDAPGSHQLFINGRGDPGNPWALPRPPMAIVAGLGEEGKLRALDLVHTVRQAVIAYAQRVAELGQGPRFELAATLLGSGGTGISVGQAAQLVAQGAREANTRLAAVKRPRLAKLTLIELYLERAGDAWRALQVLEQSAPGQYQLDAAVTNGSGALRRQLESGYRGAAYDLVSAVSGYSYDDGQPSIAYTVDSSRARTELRAQKTQGKLVRQLIERASNSASTDDKIGRTLFKLLVPFEIGPLLGGNAASVIELDPSTASIPWELLDTDEGDPGGGEREPWAIRTRLLRKLRLQDFRAQVVDASTSDHVLVIGEPKVDEGYGALPGARAEARAVAERLRGPGGLDAGRIVELTSGADEAPAIVNALLDRDYRIVHIAGHGEYGAKGGVVLSGGTFIGANEVRAMRKVPELVFLNCCHLANLQTQLGQRPYDRAAFAAGIAEELIRIGVRCVVAAGWAVEDEPAKEFATTFYAELLRQSTFGEAVARARRAARAANRRGNTWAAYQCYGDPAWFWRREGADGQRPSAQYVDEYAGIASPVGLAMALEAIAVETQYGGGRRAQEDRRRIALLEERHAVRWGSMGAVAEAYGLAWQRVGDAPRAIDWYRKAVAASDGSASFKAAEQLGNLLARRASDLAGFEESIARLKQLHDLQPTGERASLLGSACKRRLKLETDPARQLATLDEGARYYAESARLKRDAGEIDVYYPLHNSLCMKLRLAYLRGAKVEIESGEWTVLLQSLQAAPPDFWSIVGMTEARMFEAVAAGNLADGVADVVAEFERHHQRVSSVSNWESVYDNAVFVLEPYTAPPETPPAERAAAQRVLKQLGGYAGKPRGAS